MEFNVSCKERRTNVFIVNKYGDDTVFCIDNFNGEHFVKLTKEDKESLIEYLIGSQCNEDLPQRLEVSE